MRSVKGTFQNGVAQPAEAINGHDGQSVIITFLSEENTIDDAVYEAEAQALMDLISRCAMETGIEDLGHQHDH